MTDARLVVSGSAVALDGVLSSRGDAEPGRWCWPRESWWAVGGAVMLLAAAVPAWSLALAEGVPAFPRLLAGAVAAMLGVLAGFAVREAWRQRFWRLERFQLVLGTAAGEFPAFTDADEELVRRVAAALAKALADRRG